MLTNISPLSSILILLVRYSFLLHRNICTNDMVSMPSAVLVERFVEGRKIRRNPANKGELSRLR